VYGMNNHYVELLDEFKKIRCDELERRKAFMDVSGYPHYENVVSNILAFLLDDNEEHKMGNLWLQSLLSVIRETPVTSNALVNREVLTSKGNRIDMVVITDDYVICIENKIFAPVYNDLDDYSNAASKINREKTRKQVNIILSLHPCKQINGFRNVTYSELFTMIRQQLGSYLDSCDNTWLLYIKDFMMTIEGLIGGTTMNTEFGEFYQRYHEGVDRLTNEKHKYFTDILPEIRAVQGLVQDKLKDIMKGYAIHYSDAEPYGSELEMRRSVYIGPTEKGESCCKHCFTQLLEPF